jgi:hypothetical protein
MLVAAVSFLGSFLFLLDKEISVRNKSVHVDLKIIYFILLEEDQQQNISLIKTIEVDLCIQDHVDSES